MIAHDKKVDELQKEKEVEEKKIEAIIEGSADSYMRRGNNASKKRDVKM